MSEIYWNQGVNQIWFPEEFDISRDLNSWNESKPVNPAKTFL
jgi:ribonucleotide reductase beta subunit family protein with ferritin-like domain